MVTEPPAALMLDLDKVKTLREALNLSQGDAADRAGLKAGRSQWNDIESGRRSNVTLETLGKIAAALEVDPAELLVKPAAKGKGKAKGK
ncbi:MAG TPA: helix-turn-helix transcriptional regulator [Tepidisphaeraceae bacterium]|nr:helix-turn-helix transcriptional regulator [Tepidisphaeraceae bacterium]